MLNGENISFSVCVQPKWREYIYNFYLSEDKDGNLLRVFIHVHLLKASKSVLCYLIPLLCIITVYMTGENIVFMTNFLLAVEYWFISDLMLRTTISSRLLQLGMQQCWLLFRDMHQLWCVARLSRSAFFVKILVRCQNLCVLVSWHVFLADTIHIWTWKIGSLEATWQS